MLWCLIFEAFLAWVCYKVYAYKKEFIVKGNGHAIMDF